MSAQRPDYFETVEDDDPRRCQGIVSGSRQCSRVRHDPSKFCLAHGGNNAETMAVKESARNYQLTRYKVRVDSLADSSVLKSLKEEIGILRMMLESRLNSCATDTDLFLFSDSISKMVTDIEKLVTSCHRLEEKTGSMVDKNKLLIICEIITGVIAEYVTDPDALNMIGMRVGKAITDTVNII